MWVMRRDLLLLWQMQVDELLRSRLDMLWHLSSVHCRGRRQHCLLFVAVFDVYISGVMIIAMEFSYVAVSIYFVATPLTLIKYQSRPPDRGAVGLNGPSIV